MIDHINVFDARYATMDNEHFEGSDAEGVAIHRSPDGTHLTIVTRYPGGVRFRYGAAVDYFETFYVVQGSGQRTFSDGTTVPMRAGDLIFVQPGVDIDYVYDPGFMDVAFFWSDKALPSSLTGKIPDALVRI